MKTILNQTKRRQIVLTTHKLTGNTLTATHMLSFGQFGLKHRSEKCPLILETPTAHSLQKTHVSISSQSVLKHEWLFYKCNHKSYDLNHKSPNDTESEETD
jgi:hypothetical protein